MPDNARIEQLRPPKKPVDSSVPYLFFHEREPDGHGTIQPVNTIFLVNRECPFRCLMCDLWKHTLDEPTPEGAIPRQINYALRRLPGAEVVKLYNNGNFFDRKAVPEKDHRAIAEAVSQFGRVVVENHPLLCGDRCTEFDRMIGGTLEIAIGLETIHPGVLPRLNKQFSTNEYRHATGFLSRNNISIRTFLLLNPPYITDREENMEWILRSIEFAFENGSDCCSIIPTRSGNGIMERLRESGDYVPPTLDEIERVLERVFLSGLKGRIFTDLWNLKEFASCTDCFEARKQRLEQINLQQHLSPAIDCHCREYPT